MLELVRSFVGYPTMPRSAETPQMGLLLGRGYNRVREPEA